MFKNKRTDRTVIIIVTMTIIMILIIEGTVLFVVHSILHTYMKRDYWLILVACIVGGIMILWNSIDDEEEDEKQEHPSPPDSGHPFIPTHEWQEVKEGQAIPPVLQTVLE